MLATRFGSFAVELLLRGEFGMMTALQSPDIVAVPLEKWWAGHGTFRSTAT